MSGEPTVSIGLPVFNGERYVRAAIESVLAQTYGDFELIISDNASTDATAEICRGLAALDARIRLHGNPANVGAAANFNRLVEGARGRFFKWVAHDDLLDASYLTRTVAVLDEQADAVASHSRVAFIDEDSQVVRADPHPLRLAGAARASQRFADCILTPHWSFWAFALIRREALARTQLIAPYASSDRVLIAHLALLGRFLEVPEVLFFSRDHPERAIKKIPERLRRPRLLRAVGPLPAAEWYDPSRSGRIALPQWNLGWRYVDLIRKSRLSGVERRSCYLSLVRWLGCNRNAVRLGRDLLLAAEQLLARAGSVRRASLAGGKRSVS